MRGFCSFALVRIAGGRSQLLRYVNWVRKELADPEQQVRGIILCRTMTEDLRLACAGLPNVELFEYQLSVTVKQVPAMDL